MAGAVIPSFVRLCKGRGPPYGALQAACERCGAALLEAMVSTFPNASGLQQNRTRLAGNLVMNTPRYPDDAQVEIAVALLQVIGGPVDCSVLQHAMLYEQHELAVFLARTVVFDSAAAAELLCVKDYPPDDCEVLFGRFGIVAAQAHLLGAIRNGRDAEFLRWLTRGKGLRLPDDAVCEALTWARPRCSCRSLAVP